MRNEDLPERVRGLPREVEPPADVWRGIAAQLRPGATPRPIPRPDAAWGLSPSFASWRIRPAVAAALALALGASLWLHLRNRPGWRIESATGRSAAASGTIATDAASSVRLAVGGIGRVDLAPRTRVRLLAARRTEHRLALDVGSIEARISAAPRLFVVETPSATATDLGCEYALAVDPRGGSLLHVTVGWVELEGRGRTSIVPFNMSAYSRPGFAPGTPFRDRAPDSLKAALYRFDFAGEAAAVATVVAGATTNDAVTLWHLLPRTGGPEREAVYRKLAALAPPPASVTREEILRLDRRALRAWWDALPGSPGTLPWWQRAAVKISAWMGVL